MSRTLFGHRSSHERISFLLIISTLFWMIGFLVPYHIASAAPLTGAKDTISDSAPSANANHAIEYYNSSTVTSGQTIKFQFDPTNDLFALGSLNVTTDISVSGMTLVTSCGGGGDEVTATLDSSAPDENVTLTVCAGDTIPIGTTTVSFVNNHITNPATPGTYTVRISGTQSNSADVVVAIINSVTLSAAVDTSLTFTISGVAIGSSVNGDATTTATTTSAILIPFGTLASGTAKLAAQDLSVSTNAQNGFTVTVKQDQNLLSASGADVDLFKDGAANVTPTAWTAPTSVVGNENTFGHYGVTSEDADLNGDEFGTALYAGNFGTTSRVVFSHNGISDGATANIGATRVGFKIQISSLQEPGNDYSNQFIYVCTPSF
jgi:hypothetical protein